MPTNNGQCFIISDLVNTYKKKYIVIKHAIIWIINVSHNKILTNFGWKTSDARNFKTFKQSSIKYKVKEK